MALGALFERDLILFAFFIVIRLHLLGLVTIVTIAGVFCIVRHVARFARNLTLVTVVKMKNVPSQYGRRPGRYRMTARTIEAKLTHVDVWFLVAGHTFAGRAGKKLVNVAILALGRVVCSIQDKDLVVGESEHAVIAIVTTDTLLTKTFRMFDYDIRGSVRVAGDAVDPRSTESVLSMTVRASNRRFFATVLVTEQTKAGQSPVIYISKR